MIDVSARHLRAFLAVADELHFGRAAQRLGIAQSALSQQIRRLEDTVETELLTRTSRRVALTPAGVEMRAGAERLLDDLDRLILRTRAASAGQVGTVTIGSQAAALSSLVPDIIAALACRAPSCVSSCASSPPRNRPPASSPGRSTSASSAKSIPGPACSSKRCSTSPSTPSSRPHTDSRTAPRSIWPSSPTSRSCSGAASDRPRSSTTSPPPAAPRASPPASPTRCAATRPGQGLIAAGLGVSLEAASYADAGHRQVRFLPLNEAPITARIQLAWTPGRSDPRRDLVLRVARETANP